jgi:hypothetical protein
LKKPLKDVYTDLDFATDRLSAQVRTLALGILALVWTFLSAAKDVIPLKLGGSKEPLVIIGALCILALLLDLLQYVAFYISANGIRKVAERAKSTEAEYDEGSPARMAQTFLFWAKQLVMIGAAVWLLALIFVTVR